MRINRQMIISAALLAASVAQAAQPLPEYIGCANDVLDTNEAIEACFKGVGDEYPYLGDLFFQKQGLNRLAKDTFAAPDGPGFYVLTDDQQGTYYYKTPRVPYISGRLLTDGTPHVVVRFDVPGRGTFRGYVEKPGSNDVNKLIVYTPKNYQEMNIDKWPDKTFRELAAKARLDDRARGALQAAIAQSARLTAAYFERSKLLENPKAATCARAKLKANGVSDRLLSRCTKIEKLDAGAKKAIAAAQTHLARLNTASGGNGKAESLRGEPAR